MGKRAGFEGLEKAEIDVNALESTVLPFTEYCLDIKLPIKQTDHYAIRLFLRIVLFLNDRVPLLSLLSIPDPPLLHHHSLPTRQSPLLHLQRRSQSLLHPLPLRIARRLRSDQSLPSRSLRQHRAVPHALSPRGTPFHVSPF